MERTPQQNERLHALIFTLRIDKEEKAELVKAFTNGRSYSSKDLTYAEADLLIKYLDNTVVESIKKMRSKIINIAKDIGLVKPHPNPPQQGGNVEVDWERLNKFLIGKFKQPLHLIPKDVLPKAVTAMEKWRDGNLKKELGI